MTPTMFFMILASIWMVPTVKDENIHFFVGVVFLGSAFIHALNG